MDTPLTNTRHERFCQLVSGSCFGNASKAYTEAGFRATKRDVIYADASRLLSNATVSARIACLRQQRGRELAIDQTRLMELRLQCVYDTSTSWADKLRALDSIEKALGLAQPDQVRHSMAEAVIKFIHTEEPTVPSVIAAPEAVKEIVAMKPAFPSKTDIPGGGIF